MTAKDILEFERLYNIKINIVEDFDYYIDILSKSNEFENIHELKNNFIQYVNDIKSLNTYSNVNDYKHSCINKIVEYLTKTKSYTNINNYNCVYKNLRSKSNKLENDTRYISLDIKSANYTVFKLFSADINEIPDTFQDLCEKLDIHKALTISKSFRQIIFGNMNIKKNSTIQKVIINELVDILLINGILEDDIIVINTDEIIVKYSDVLDDMIFENYIRKTYFTVNNLTSEMYVKYLYKDSKYYENVYSKLVGCQKQFFYYYFRKYILFSVIDERDLMFMYEGEKCKMIKDF